MKLYSLISLSAILCNVSAATSNKHISKDTVYDGTNKPLPQLGKLDIDPDVYYSVYNTDIKLDSDFQNYGELFLTGERSSYVVSSTSNVLNKGLISVSAPVGFDTILSLDGESFENSGGVYVKAAMVGELSMATIKSESDLVNLGSMSFENTNNDPVMIELGAGPSGSVKNSGTIYLKNIYWNQDLKTEGNGCIVLGDNGLVSTSMDNDDNQNYYLASGSSVLQLNGNGIQEFKVQGFGNKNTINFPDFVTCTYDETTGVLHCDRVGGAVTYMLTKRGDDDEFNIFIGTGYDPAMFSTLDNVREVYYEGAPPKGPSGKCFVPGDSQTAPRSCVTTTSYWSNSFTSQITMSGIEQTVIVEIPLTTSMPTSSSSSISLSSSISSAFKTSSSATNVTAMSTNTPTISRHVSSSKITVSSKSNSFASESIVSSSAASLAGNNSILSMSQVKSTSSSSSPSSLLLSSKVAPLSRSSSIENLTVTSNSAKENYLSVKSFSTLSISSAISSDTPQQKTITGYSNWTSSASESSNLIVTSKSSPCTLPGPSFQSHSSMRDSGMYCVTKGCASTSSNAVKIIDSTLTSKILATSCINELCVDQVSSRQAKSSSATTTTVVITPCSEVERSLLITNAEDKTSNIMVTVTSCSDKSCSATQYSGALSVVTKTKHLYEESQITSFPLSTNTKVAQRLSNSRSPAYPESNKSLQTVVISASLVGSYATKATINNSSVANFGITVNFSVLSLLISFLLCL